jgi:hypothetical protein
LPRADGGVVGVDHLDEIFAEIDERDDVFLGAEVRLAEADRRPQFLADGIAEDLGVAATGVLDAVANARLLQGLFQAPRATQGGVRLGQAVNRREAVVAGQGLQGTPAAPARRAVPHPAGGGDFHFRPGGTRDKQEEHLGEAAERLGHAKTLNPG